MGHFLVNSATAATAAPTALVALALELGMLWCTILAYNVATVTTALQSRMDTGQLAEYRPGHATYMQYLVMLIHMHDPKGAPGHMRKAKIVVCICIRLSVTGTGCPHHQLDCLHVHAP